MQISERDKSVVFKGGIEAESNLSVDGNITVVGTVDGKDVSTLLANVVEDTAPQLGGPLDLNSQGITDSTGIDLNSNVFIPTSSLHIGSTATPAESLHITNGSVKIDNGVNPYTLPSSDGSANQVISTDGSGTLTFVDQSGGLDGIVDDTAPQLGGDLDVNGRKITSTSNGDIDIEPNGTGNVLLGNFEFDVDQAVGAGQDNYVLTYDNTLGTISLEAAAGGSVDTSGTPADDQIAIFTDADTIEGDSSFTWNGTQLTVGGQANIDKISVTKGTGISAAGDFGIGSRVLTKFGAATTGLTAGDVYYLGSSAWVQADADAASSASGILAVATDTTSTPGMVKEGLVKMADSSDFSAASAGDVVYLSTAAGHVTASAPSQGGDIVRVVGYVFEPSNGIIYFDPSKDWIELV
jgi:hypothetical protein